MNRFLGTSFLTLLLGAAASPGLAQEPAAAERKLGWASTAELTLVTTSGNSETSTLGLRATATRTWEEALLKIEGGALRAEQTNFARRAVGPPGDVVLVEDEDSELTAENYFLRGQYDHTITGRLFAFGGAGWERDELAGLANRYFVAAGVGHAWADTEDFVSRTSYGVTYTREEDVSGLENDFLGLRVTWDFLRRLTPSTVFTNLLILDENLDETSDYRADNLAAIAVAINERLALKASLQLKYDNEPSFVGVPREFPDGVPTGDTVPFQLDELDTILSAALVLNF